MNKWSVTNDLSRDNPLESVPHALGSEGEVRAIVYVDHRQQVCLKKKVELGVAGKCEVSQNKMRKKIIYLNQETHSCPCHTHHAMNL